MCVHMYMYLYILVYTHMANGGQTIDLPYYNVFQYQ